MEEQQAAVLDPIAEDQREVTPESDALSDKEMNFRALREELTQMKQEKERLEQNFDTWKRELARAPAKAEPPVKRFVDDLSNDDYLTGAQLKAALQEQERAFREDQHKKDQENALMLNEVLTKAKYSDYDDVVSKYGIPLIEQEPDLADAFLAAKNKPGYLYKIGVMAMQSQQPRTEPARRSEQAKAVVANSQKPRTLSGDVSGAQKMNPTDYYESMSDADFLKMVRKNLGEI